MIYAFDDADDALTYMPTAARRACDRAGKKPTLVAWQNMSIQQKRALVDLGSTDSVDVARVHAILADATSIDPVPDPTDPPEGISASDWAILRPLDRYALVKNRKKDKWERVRREILRERETPKRTPT